MTPDEFKKLIEDALEPLKDEQAKMRQEFEEMKDTINNKILPPLTYIETTVKSYADRYVTNEDHIRRLDKRLKKTENKLDIFVPDDLTIPSAE